MKKRWIPVALVCALLLGAVSLWGCGAPRALSRFSGEFLELFDTHSQVIGYAESQSEFEAMIHDLREELRSYHELYNIYQEYDGVVNLKNVNDQAGKGPIEVDRKIIDLLLFAQEMERFTGGKVNYAYGAVLALWHDARERAINDPEHAAIPSREALEAAAQHVDPSKVRIDPEAGTVELLDPAMRLDVGAIAKGYAVEQVARYIAAKYPEMPVLIGIGGNIRAVGYKDPATQTPWSVGIQNPDGDAEQAVLQSIQLVDRSMVTSGDYQRYFTVDGKNYHHIIDPETHMPAVLYRSVTIMTADSGRADALSTATYLLPLEEAMALIESLPDTEAYFVLADGSTVWTKGLEAWFKE